jgi:hypothetical protein
MRRPTLAREDALNERLNTAVSRHLAAVAHVDFDLFSEEMDAVFPELQCRMVQLYRNLGGGYDGRNLLQLLKRAPRFETALRHLELSMVKPSRWAVELLKPRCGKRHAHTNACLDRTA